MSGFDIQKKHEGDTVVLQLKGYLDAHTAPQLETALQECLAKKEYKIIANFSQLSYISSAGLGVFMGFIEEVRKNGGDIKLCCMNAKIYRIFDLLGFPTLYEILDTEEEAREKFDSNSV